MNGMPVPQLADSFKWTAAMSFTVLVHGVALLSPLIKQKDEPMWVNFMLAQRFLLGLLQWSATIGQIRQIDLQVREHAAGQRAIWQFKPLVKYKNHAELHAADNFMRICPPRAGWCLKGAAHERERERVCECMPWVLMQLLPYASGTLFLHAWLHFARTSPWRTMAVVELPENHHSPS